MGAKKTTTGRGGDGLYRKRGIWYFRTIDWTGKRRALSTRTENYAEARQRRADYLEDAKRGTEKLRSGKLTFAEAAQVWLERRLLDAAENTQRAYRQRAERACELIGQMPLDAITAAVLRRYQIERRKTIAPASVNAETKLIAGVLGENKLWERIKPDFRKMKEPKTAGVVIPAEDREKLAATQQKRHDAAPILLIAQVLGEHGLRHNELKSLRLGDIDLERRIVQIPRASTKSDAGARLIPLTDDAVAALDQLLDRAYQLGACEPEHYLFPGCDFVTVPGRKHRRRVPNPNKPQYSFGDAWRTLRRNAGLGQVRLHDFRHTVATDMAQAGVPASVGLRLMGWSSPEMRKRYEHIQDTALRRETDRLAEYRRARQAEMQSAAQAEVIPMRSKLRLVR